MKDLDEEKKIAVLIDADNAQYSKLKFILDELSTHGHIITKRAYADWSQENLKNWKTQLNEYSIQPIQQFAYTSKKNSTDALMIIDAMDLLYTDKYDAFALVSSDCDFTKLASRLRESEIFVFGVGETKTPTSFRNACDNFILVENLGIDVTVNNFKNESSIPIDKMDAIEGSLGVDHKTKELTFDEFLNLLDRAAEKYSDDDGWTNVASTGTFIQRLRPDFDPRSYGYTKLPKMIESYNAIYEMKKYSGKGGVMIVAYRRKQDMA